VTPPENFEDLLCFLMGPTNCDDLKERLADDVNYRTCSTDAVAWLAGVLGPDRLMRALVDSGVLVELQREGWNGETVSTDMARVRRPAGTTPLYRVATLDDVHGAADTEEEDGRTWRADR
jgi:hypothetical protein